jgi:exopolysaccharide production protein ExoY
MTYKIIKNIFDKLFAIFAIFLLSPIYLFLSIIILFYDGYPIFFRQERVGLNGRVIKVIKFRSMLKNAEVILKNDPKLYDEYVKNGYKLDASRDPRILPFGKFIRKTSLDEIPQFFNVLFNDMSVVGPRPVLDKELIELYADNANFYKSVKPGITGLWQVSGRSEIKNKQRVELDMYYIQKKSIFFDIYIIIKTIKTVLDRRGAY